MTEYKRVLCVCSQGWLRSPTAAWVLGNEPFSFDTRSCGTDMAYDPIVPVSATLIEWADEIICMEEEHRDDLLRLFPNLLTKGTPITVWHISDMYDYRQPELITIIELKARRQWNQS